MIMYDKLIFNKKITAKMCLVIIFAVLYDTDYRRKKKTPADICQRFEVFWYLILSLQYQFFQF